MTPKNRKRTLAAIIGGLLGIASIATAAMLLSASITGSTGYADSTGGFVVVSASGTNVGNVKCNDTTKTGDNSFRVNAVVKRVNGVVQTGSCELTVVLSNQGNTDVRLTGGKLSGPGSEGWNLVPTGSISPTIPAGGTVTYKANLTATPNAAAGDLSGSITGELVSSAS